MYWSKNISHILSFCLCNFDRVVIVRSILCKMCFPLRVNPKNPEKNPTFPFFMQSNILAPDDFFFNYSLDGWDAHPDHQMTTMKTDLAVLGFDGGIWCPRSGSNDRTNNVCMGATCCSACIHAEMEHFDLGQKPLKLWWILCLFQYKTYLFILLCGN